LMVMAGLLSERTRLAACVGRSAYGRDENGAGHPVPCGPRVLFATPRGQCANGARKDAPWTARSLRRCW